MTIIPAARTSRLVRHAVPPGHYGAAYRTSSGKQSVRAHSRRASYSPCRLNDENSRVKVPSAVEIAAMICISLLSPLLAPSATAGHSARFEKRANPGSSARY